MFTITRIVIFLSFLLVIATAFEIKVSNDDYATLELIDAFPNIKFENATDFRYLPNSDHDRVYVALQNGRIFTFRNSIDVSQRDVSKFLDLSDKVAYKGEAGLLGFTFHPKFPTTPYIYVVYIQEYGTRMFSKISRFTASSIRHCNPYTEQNIMTIPQPYDNHKGGSIFFGNDGYLYCSIGDGGSEGDPENLSQNTFTHLGKLLRFDVDNVLGVQPYTIPFDNPFIHGGGYPEVYAYGLRNPWRCSIDSLTDTIWCGDVGEGRWEEINIVEKGQNYGWKKTEGPECFQNPNCNADTYVQPLYYYPHPDHRNASRFNFTGSAVIGGVVYRGSEIPWLQGQYLFGDHVSQKLGALKRIGDRVEVQAILGPTDFGEFHISGFGVDRNQEVYFLGHGKYQLPILRIKPPNCGNGVVEDNEDCDFGNETENVWSNHCCLQSVCKLAAPGTLCGKRGACNIHGQCVS